MIIVLKPGSTDDDIGRIKDVLKDLDLQFHISRGKHRTIIGLVGDEQYVPVERVNSLECVEDVIRVMKPYKLVAREFNPGDSIVYADDVPIGDGFFTVMAGPCAVEDREMIMETAEFLSSLGVKILRGGAFKPRTSPYSFQGLGLKGLEYLREAGEKFGMKVITEVVGESEIDLVYEYADILQIGTRNAQNFSLLKRVGEKPKPILLKRGFMNTVEELLLAAEYIALKGNMNIVLCERGIRTFETSTRNTLDISAVPVIKIQSHLPVIVDPSHASGRRDIIAPLAKAAMAAGANGIIVEVHPHPENALSDGKQSLNFEEFEALYRDLEKLSQALGVKMA
ncbi:MAG: 3-deoxy-7-phosphoheptulonate synthase [Thermotogota bacterium]|nr:3-deoxy-7-phosphoheptulonate synthase [Thermotogota bacterium]MDK2865495.1 3-deoxy-7-phosphoheptulonate synthase [Thermotogota bacterium]HCZ06933.1 3-deoxy-7-phosphoheptulonate synthase [Thermotogota bacterium]